MGANGMIPYIHPKQLIHNVNAVSLLFMLL